MWSILKYVEKKITINLSKQAKRKKLDYEKKADAEATNIENIE